MINLSGQCNYAKKATTKSTKTPGQLWIKIGNGNCKKRVSVVIKGKQRRHKILFLCKSRGQLKSEADLMLALNKRL